jgi:hypothetical protein
MPCSPLNSDDVLEEHVAAIFRVEAKQETSIPGKKSGIAVCPLLAWLTLQP